MSTAWPAAAACCQRQRPVAPAGWRAAGTGNEHREGWFEPRNSPDNVLRKHEGCDEESARWRVQGALDQAGRQRAAASACATQGGLAGRTCPGEALCRPFHVRLVAEDKVDLTAVGSLIERAERSFERAKILRTAPPQPSSRPSHIKKKTSRSSSLASLRERLSYVSLRDADPSQRPDFS